MIARVRNEVQNFCSEFGFSLEKAEKQLSDIGEFEFHKAFPTVYFTVASHVLKSSMDILEIGTACGNTTRVLSKLFPKTNIYTVDLPDTDPEYSMTAWRCEALNLFEENMLRDNIHFIASNSLLLPSIDLPGKFDLIYVDGGHHHPIVGCDIVYSYNRLRKGGFMFMHDYKTGNDVSKVVNCLDGIIDEEFRLLPANYKNPESKMAWLRKK